MKKYLLAGSVSYFSVVILCVAFFALGQKVNNKPTRIAVVEKGAIVLEAALERQDAPKEVLEAEIVSPIRTILQKYVDMGYLVIDTSADDAGNISVAALPSDVIDISNELRAAIRAKASNSTKLEAK